MPGIKESRKALKIKETLTEDKTRKAVGRRAPAGSFLQEKIVDKLVQGYIIDLNTTS